MKTSVIEVGGMLSALSSHGVEQQLGKLKGVYSATVNYAAANATVRYDETQVTIAEIKARVYKCGYQANEALPRHVIRHKPAQKHGSVAHGETHAAMTPQASPAATPKPAEMPKAEAATTAVPEGIPAAAPTPATAPSAPAIEDHPVHTAHGQQPAMSSDMAREMGHGGDMDLPAMARDMRNRFWICLLFAVPIFVYSPMGNLFPAPSPPFGLALNQWLFGLASAAILYPSWQIGRAHV